MRPEIICHMMSTVDGRIVGNRWTLPCNGVDINTVIEPYYDISRELGADAQMLGRKTVQTDLVPSVFDHGNSPAVKNPQPFRGANQTERMCIVLDPTGKIRYSENTLMGEKIAVILGETVSEAYLAHLRELDITYLFAGKDGSDLHKALEILGEMGIRKLVLQGGGIINGTFLKAGLIDELSLLVYPGVDGLSGIPTIFECMGAENVRPADGQSLELVSVRELAHGVVWLRYRFHRVSQTGQARPELKVKVLHNIETGKGK